MFATEEFLACGDGRLVMASLFGGIAEVLDEPFGWWSRLFVEGECGFEEVDRRIPFVEL